MSILRSMGTSFDPIIKLDHSVHLPEDNAMFNSIKVLIVEATGLF